jgi:hypothetical protein
VVIDPDFPILERPKALPNSSQNAFQVLQNILVHESHDNYPVPPQVLRAPFVIAASGVAIVRSAVELDCKPSTGTIEVDYEWTDAVLTAEFPAELPSLQATPEACFGNSQRAAQFAPAHREFGTIVEWPTHVYEDNDEVAVAHRRYVLCAALDFSAIQVAPINEPSARNRKQPTNNNA